MLDRRTLLKSAYAMPLISPGFAPTGTRFCNRETLKVHYRTDRAALEKWVPEPLKIVDPMVAFEVVKMPDASGCGSFHSHDHGYELWSRRGCLRLPSLSLWSSNLDRRN